MLINNRTSRFLSGPFIFFGLIFLFLAIVGLINKEWLFFIPNVFIAWFLLGTYSGVLINTKTQSIKEYNCWFGLVKTGQWQPLKEYVGLTLVSMKMVERMYSRSNRINKTQKKEFRIYLVDANKRPAIAIKKLTSLKAAQNSIDEYAIWLKKPVFSIKR
jgi:hypothetical protein